MSEAVIIDALRTPRGRGNPRGALAGVRPVDLLAAPLRALAERHDLPGRPLADAVFGCVTQTGEQGANIGKLALIAAGWDDRVPALTVNRFCASGISAGQHRRAARAADRRPGDRRRGGKHVARAHGNPTAGPLTHDGAFQQAARLVPIGISADAVATLEGLSRADCDAYAAESQRRAVAARDGGAFRSLVPVGGLAQDETPRPGTSAESLAALEPAFAEMGAAGGGCADRPRIWAWGGSPMSTMPAIRRPPRMAPRRCWWPAPRRRGAPGSAPARASWPRPRSRSTGCWR
ncbi:MAG: hypothetical protein KatS3mg118_3684 [Paracoccaceae bacterium]|nr:MAG: hypothetical protein KatS3mg118_3684 [Paracoccaceae bacterium]